MTVTDDRREALVVIDVQNDFVDDGGVGASIGYRVKRCQERMPGVIQAIDAARGAGVPVIFVKTEHSEWTDDRAWKSRLGGAAHRERMCVPGSWGGQFHQVKPDPGEPVVVKHRYSAFVGTDLGIILRSLEIRALAFAGFAANVCVESSLRHGFMLGYEVTLLLDATASAFSDEELTATAHNVENFFGDVRTVGEWSTGLPRDASRV